MESALTMNMDQFERLAERVVIIMQRMAAQAEEAGNRVNTNLWRGSAPAAQAASNNITQSMGRVQASAATAGAAVGQAGARAGAAAAGYGRLAGAAGAAGGAQLSFAQKTGILFARLGQFGNNAAGIVNGVKAIAEVWRRFRGQAAPVQQVAAAVQQTGAAANAAAPPQRNLAERLLKIIKVSSAAGLAIFGLVKAYRDLGAVSQTAAAPKMPDVGKSMRDSIGSSGPSILAVVAALVAAIGASFAALKVGEIIKDSVVAAVDAEQLQVSMEVMLGGVEEATKMIADLRKRSDISPYTATDYTKAGRSLLAFGEEADKVGNTLDRIGDITAGIGGKSQQFGEIAEIYGKARVQGQLFAEDINQLTGRGIPVIQEFAKQLGVTPAAVKKLASEGKVTFAMLEQAFVDLTSNGGKFEGLALKLGKTTGGLWSTMLGEIESVQLALGKPINDQIRPMLSAVVARMGDVREAAGKLGSAIGDSLKMAITAVKELGTGGALSVMGDGLKLAFMESVNVLYAGLQGSLAVFGAGVGAAAMVFVTIFGEIGKPEFWAGLGNVLLGIGAQFSAMLIEAVASMAAGVRSIPGLGLTVGNLPEQLRATAQGMRIAAGGAMSSAGQQLDPVIKEGMKQFDNFLKAMPGAFKEAFGKASEVFDTKEERGRMQQVLDGIQKRLAADAAKAAEVAKSVQAAAPEIPKVKENAIATPGMFASAVNLLMGRSPGELMVEEAKRQTALLQKIEQNTSKPVQRPNVTQSKPVDMTPRFA